MKGDYLNEINVVYNDGFDTRKLSRREAIKNIKKKYPGIDPEKFNSFSELIQENQKRKSSK